MLWVKQRMYLNLSPVLVTERPKALAEPSKAETPPLPEEGKSISDEKKESEKAIVTETPTPKVQADVNVNQSREQNIGGSADLTKS